MKIVSILIIYTKYILISGWLDESDYYVFITFFVNKQKLLHFWLTQFFGWCGSKCYSFSPDLCKTYAIFLHQDRQLSWWFCTFEWDTQLWYTDTGNFHDNFMFLIKWHHFYTKIGKFPTDFMTWTRYAIFIWWISCIFRVPYEKTDSTNQKWPETIKIWKSPKINLRKNVMECTQANKNGIGLRNQPSKT